MNPVLQLTAGILLGVSLGLWAPFLLSPQAAAVRAVEAEASAPDNEHGKPDSDSADGKQDAAEVVLAAAPEPVVHARTVVAETLRTGDPRRNGREPIQIEGDLPQNLRFAWNDDPASGLSPAFLWEKAPGQWYLGTRRIPRQDGDILHAYAFDAPAVVPDHYEGRLIFHRKVLGRLLEWSASLPPENQDSLLVRVERADAQTVRIRLPAVATVPETELTITL